MAYEWTSIFVNENVSYGAWNLTILMYGPLNFFVWNIPLNYLPHLFFCHYPSEVLSVRDMIANVDNIIETAEWIEVDKYLEVMMSQPIYSGVDSLFDRKNKLIKKI